MTYETFKNTILDRLAEDIPDPKAISVRPVYHNNGKMLEGLVILEDGANVGPTIYLNRYYEQLLDGEPFDAIYRRIVDSYEHNKTDRRVDVGFFTDFERVKERIMVRLVDREKNAAVLGERYPFVPFLDLALEFFCEFPAGADGENATIQIDNSHLKLWDVTAEELFPIAMENTQRANAPRLSDINSVLNGLMSDAGAEPLPEPEEPLFPMYVLTNSHNLFGAACMAYDGLLKTYAEKFGSGFYILPSSIHELILVPSKENDRADAFSDMVRSVNAAHVEPEDVLSDHAYYYDRSKDAVVMCA